MHLYLFKMFTAWWVYDGHGPALTDSQNSAGASSHICTVTALVTCVLKHLKGLSHENYGGYCYIQYQSNDLFKG